MPGSVVNLAVPGARIPDPIVVDTNLLVERLIVPFLGFASFTPAARVQEQRSNHFFDTLIANNGTGIITPTVFTEFVHVAIQFKYKQERNRLGADIQRRYARPIRSWLDLYKQDATILQAFLSDLRQLRLGFISNGLHIVAPDELGAIASTRTHDEELLHLVCAYGLDSNDAQMLMEAHQYGINDIVTLDADLRRAQADFNIYTWH